MTEGISEKPSYASTITAPATCSTHPSTSIRHEREKVQARHSTHNGMPAVIFKASEYYGVMADECRYTIVGRFSKTRPQIDKIRSQFKEKVKIKGSSKIGVFDNYNVFIDLTNEEDFKSVWFKRVIEIDEAQMWLQKWSPDFKPEEDLPIAPAWVLLPGLPFHLHTWHYIKQLLNSVGTPLTLDAATNGRTRPSMAKIRVEVNLLKPLPESVWVGLECDDAPLKGYVQKLEYEGVPKYCKHCRKIGHYVKECRILERENIKEVEKQKERNNGNKNNDETDHGDEYKGKNISQKESVQNKDNQGNDKDNKNDKQEATTNADKGNHESNMKRTSPDDEKKGEQQKTEDSRENNRKNKSNRKIQKMPQKKNIVLFKALAPPTKMRKYKKNKIATDCQMNKNLKGSNGEEGQKEQENSSKNMQEQTMESHTEETHVSNTMIDQPLNRESNAPQDNGHINEQEVEEGEIQSPSLPSEIKNAAPINLCVDIICDSIGNKAEKSQNREENSMESKAINNMNKDRSHEIVQLSGNEPRGRKKYRNFGRLQTLSEDPTEYRTYECDNLHDTAQSQEKFIPTESRGRTKEREKGKHTKKRSIPCKRGKGQRQSVPPPSLIHD